MIVRILTAKVPAENIGLFNDLLRAQLTELQEQPGLVYAKLARRLNENQGEEVVLVEEWRTPSELFEWTRGRLNKPRLLPGTEDLVADLTITHYEALDVAPEDLLARVVGPDLPTQAKVPPSATGDRRIGHAREARRVPRTYPSTVTNTPGTGRGYGT